MAVNSLRMRQELHYTRKVAFVTTYVLFVLQIGLTSALRFSDKQFPLPV